MEKVHVALVTDRRPGHEKQSRGVVNALRRYLSIEVTEWPVERASAAGEMLALLKYVSGVPLQGTATSRCDLVVGSGSHTHLPVLLLAREHQAKSVMCMTPPWPLRSRFDLCLSPIHDRVRQADNIFFTIGPPNTAKLADSHDPTNGLICIGGSDPASHIWDETRIVADVRNVIEQSGEPKCWTITSSPRTPASTEQLLTELAEVVKGVTFVPFKVTSPGWIERQYKLHRTVWITADSISMVYEALSSGCRVGLLPVTWKKKNSKFLFSERYLMSRGLVLPLSALLDGSGSWEKRQALDEADRCAREIVKRWWPNSLR